MLTIGLEVKTKRNKVLFTLLTEIYMLQQSELAVLTFGVGLGRR